MSDLRRQLTHIENKIVRLKREARRIYGPAWKHKSLHFRCRILGQIEKARRLREQLGVRDG